MEVDKFIPYYPGIEIDDDESEPSSFTYDIFKLKEFHDLKLSAKQEIPEPGEPFDHQKSVSRYISPHTEYDRMLMVWEPGLGKTLASSLIIENFKNVTVGGVKRSPALVIVPSEDLEKYWRSQILKFYPKEYQPEFTEEEKTRERTVSGKQKRSLQQTYEIETLDRFARYIRKTRDDVLKRVYSNRIIVIDEAHVLKIQSVKKEKISWYKTYDHFFNVVENVRIILLTATPTWDQVHEIASLINLLTPEDERLPVGKKFTNTFFPDGKLTDDHSHLEQLKSAFRGKISYLSMQKDSAPRTELGATQPWFQHIVVYPDGMSDFQSQYLEKATKEQVKREGILAKGKDGKMRYRERVVEGGEAHYYSRNASNLVVPVKEKGKTTGGFTSKYFDQYFTNKLTRKKGTKIKYAIAPELRNKLMLEDSTNPRNTNVLRKYSAKYASILEKLKASPNELAFIYNSMVKNIGGSIVLGLILELNGFQRVTNERQLLVKPSAGTRRFMLLTGTEGFSAVRQSKMIANFNRPENKYGDYCQVIIGTRRVAVGLTFRNVRQVHITTPHWNLTLEEQAIGRAYRLGSFDDLPENERYLNIYRHVSVNIAEEGEEGYDLGKGFPSDESFTDDKTIDIYIYERAEDKEVNNMKVRRFLKQIAWDCPLNYDRVVQQNYIDESKKYPVRDCDYKRCNYECYDFPSENIIRKKGKVWKYSLPEEDLQRDNYDLLYSQKLVNDIIDRIVQIFKRRFTISLDKLAEQLEILDDQRILLLQAVSRIINERIPIQDRYGFTTFMNEKNNIYFLDTSSTVHSNYLNSNYTIYPLVTERSSMEEIMENIQLEQDRKVIEIFCQSPINKSRLLDKLHYPTIILLVEKTYEISRKKKKSELTDREQEAIEVLIKKRFGRELMKIDDKVVHILYNTEYTGTGYNVGHPAIKATGKMRIFDKGQWRYPLSEDEEQEMVKILKETRKSKQEDPFSGNKYKMIGILDTKGKTFKVWVPDTPGTGKTRGRVCKTLDKNMIIDLMLANLGYYPQRLSSGKEVTSSKSELIAAIAGNNYVVNGMLPRSIKKGVIPKSNVLTKKLKTYDYKKLKGIFILLQSTRPELCSMMETKLRQLEEKSGIQLLISE